MSKAHYKIKNWERFQHYNKPRPAWIKLHRTLLDDHEFHALDSGSRALLVMLWLVAAESDEGTIPDHNTIAWRLRLPPKEVHKNIQTLTHYLEPLYTDSIADLVSDRDREERETEETSSVGSCAPTVRVREEDFKRLWTAHPYGSKAEARKAYAAVAKDLKNPIPSELLATLQRQIEERKQADRNGDFLAKLPHLCRWFKHRRWEDEPYRHQETTKDTPRQRIFSVCTVCGEASESFVHGKCAKHET